MTVSVFVFSLLGAMAIGMPIAYALLVCGLALNWYMPRLKGSSGSRRLALGPVAQPLSMSTASTKTAHEQRPIVPLD